MNQDRINDNVNNESLSNVNETSTEEVVKSNVSSSTEVADKKEEDVVKASTDKKEEEVVTDNEKDNDGLTHLDKDFVYELMSIPTLSESEYRLITFIVLWARRNNIEYEFDDYGNVYLTKGKIGEGEYYPCMTAHLDSVQTKHKLYVQAAQPLEVKTRVVKGKHEIYVDGMGIGGDDKAGVLIGLSMFNHVDKLKACFFLEEETGCRGSKNLNKDWFKDVGYVLGYDSPDLNRAAYACSGVRLFSADFFKTHMQEICKKHGLTKFHSEPFTDVKEIREQTNIICMNFGSGYYNAHSSNEYCIIEDMDVACRMGHELIEHLGLQRFELEHKSTTNSWVKMADGSYKKPEEDKDEAFFRTLGGWGGYDDFYSKGSYGNKTTTTTTTTSKTSTAMTPPSQSTVTTSQTSSAVNANKDMIEVEAVEYISQRYEEYISMSIENVKKICEKKGINFEEEFAKAFEFEIKF
ncbi:MAG: M20/M25/M40 family metallo-hydrolase [Bacilli bacterium]|nr:M20/M25/M40 family metallo-hydrolase [Bacilli bacterium]